MRRSPNKEQGINTVPQHCAYRQPGVPHTWTSILVAALLWLAMPWPATAETEKPTETIVWVEGGDKPFPALFSRQEGNKNAVLLLHDITSFANDPDLMRPFHQELPIHGWDTLVPRLPKPPRVARPGYFQELLTIQSQRTTAAIRFLQKSEYQRIIVIGHGFGSFSSIMALSTSTASSLPIKAIISLNTDWYNYPQGRRVLLRAIPRLTVPVLDIYSENSHSNTVHNASNRNFVLQKLAAKDDNTTRQVLIPYRSHHLKDTAPLLLRAINRWLSHVFADKEPAAEESDEDTSS